MRFNKIIIATGLVAIGIAVFVWVRTWSGLFGDASASHQAPESSATSSPDPRSPAGDQLTPEDQAEATRVLAEYRSWEAERSSTRRIEAALRTTSVAEDRKRLLGEMRNRHYARDEAIALLTAYLNDPDAGVRVYAAELLYEMGSAAGREALLHVMRSAVDPSAPNLSAAVSAAKVLNRFRELIPRHLLIELYDKRGHPGLLGVMAMQGDPAYARFILEIGEEPSNVIGAVHKLGVLGAPEGYSFAKQVFESTHNERAKVAAAWAMFRTAGDHNALDYVIRIAGGEPRDLNGYKGTGDLQAIHDAMRLVYITKDAAVRQLLRDSVASPYTSISSSSLVSLFYIQEDYGFVDDYLRRYFSDPAIKADSSIDGNLAWRIAVARNNPSLTALARESNSTGYQYHFVEMNGRSVVEAWIWSHLSDIPLR